MSKIVKSLDELNKHMNVATIEDLSNLSFNGTAIVADSLRGGTFIYDSTKSAINDGGIVFNGWVRQYTGTIFLEWFGAIGDCTTATPIGTDNVDAIHACILAVKDLGANTSQDGQPLVISGNGVFGITRSLSLTTARGAIFRDIEFKALLGNPLDADYLTTNVPMIKSTKENITLDGCVLDCSKFAAGAIISNRCKIDKCTIYNFQDYGLKLIEGDTWVTNCYINQWFSGDEEFKTYANWTAKGVWFTVADCKMMETTIRWCGVPVYYDTDASTTLIADCHFYNGNSGVNIIDGLPLATEGETINTAIDTVNIMVKGGGLLISNCYIDNGAVEVYSQYTRLIGNRFISGQTKVNNSHCVAVYADGTLAPEAFYMSDSQIASADIMDGTVKLISFLSDGSNTWTYDYSNIVSSSPRNLSVGGRNILASTDDTDVLTLKSPRDTAYGAVLSFEDASTTITTKPFIRSTGDGLRLKADEFYLETLGGGILRLLDGVLNPKEDGSMELGSTDHLWKTIHLDKMIHMEAQSVEPTPKYEGTMAISDGTASTNNFGVDGAGLYRTSGAGAWIHIG